MGHFIFRWDQSLKLESEAKVWDLINMQNDRVSDRSSQLTDKRRYFFQRSVRGGPS